MGDETRYAFVSGTGLLLTCAADGWNVTTLAFDAWSNPLAQWQALPQPEGDGYYIFVASSGGVLYSDSLGAISVWLEDYTALRQYVLWSSVETTMRIDDHIPWWQYIVNPGVALDESVRINSYLAIRPSFDTDRNLNVLGNGPYQPGNLVAAWSGWDGGDQNEVWKLVSIADLENPPPEDPPPQPRFPT